jgi:hypothetical protein
VKGTVGVVKRKKVKMKVSEGEKGSWDGDDCSSLGGGELGKKRVMTCV